MSDDKVVPLPNRDSDIRKRSEALAKDWRLIYSAFRNIGFDDSQAFELLLQAILED